MVPGAISSDPRYAKPRRRPLLAVPAVIWKLSLNCALRSFLAKAGVSNTLSPLDAIHFSSIHSLQTWRHVSINIPSLRRNWSIVFANYNKLFGRFLEKKVTSDKMFLSGLGQSIMCLVRFISISVNLRPFMYFKSMYVLLTTSSIISVRPAYNKLNILGLILLILWVNVQEVEHRNEISLSQTSKSFSRVTVLRLKKLRTTRNSAQEWLWHYLSMGIALLTMKVFWVTIIEKKNRLLTQL